MPDWEFSEPRPTLGDDYDCGCPCCPATDWRPEHRAGCPIGQAASENAALRARLALADAMAEAIEMDGHAFARNYYRRIDEARAAYRASAGGES